jgi:hemoglobin-like flavoprotein
MRIDSIDDDDIRRVQLSYARVILQRDLAADLFYKHLFEEEPALRRLFRNDIEAQGSKLIGALGMIVFSMRDPERVIQAAGALAKRHVGYGVRPEYFRPFGIALMKTLDETLDPAEFDAAARRAWEFAFDRLSKLVIAALLDASKAA